MAEQTTLVRFEPYPWYADDVDDPLAACWHCGWKTTWPRSKRRSA